MYEFQPISVIVFLGLLATQVLTLLEYPKIENEMK